MEVIITGAGGFLGQRLAKTLLSCPLPIERLVLADVVPMPESGDPRVHHVTCDLLEAGAVEKVLTTKTKLVFHLAAIVSNHAEKDFDLGWRLNLDVTRRLLEAARQVNPSIRFVFASSLAVYGGKLPPVVTDDTVVTPRSSYGAQKAAAELLVNDYSRKGFVDGIALRLPTVCVRPGKPNQAASSFVSSIIREPLSGEAAICPVSPDLSLFLSSPDTVIKNLLHAAALSTSKIEGWRTFNLPGITVTVKEMLDALKDASDEKTLSLVQFKQDESIHRIVSSWPGRIDTSHALQLGFSADQRFVDFITQYRNL